LRPSSLALALSSVSLRWAESLKEACHHARMDRHRRLHLPYQASGAFSSLASSSESFETSAWELLWVLQPFLHLALSSSLASGPVWLLVWVLL